MIMNLKRTFKFALSLLVLVAIVSCSVDGERGWIKTKEGYYFYGNIAGVEKTAVYSWDGESRGVTIHGKGKLTVYSENGSYTHTDNVNAYYGTINKKDYKPTADGDFIGEVIENKPSGFGVLINENHVVIGDFEDGQVNGFCTIYDNDELRYRGETKNGSYDGLGVKFEEGVVTVGEWDEGVLAESFSSRAGKEVERLWNRVTLNNEANQQTADSEGNTNQFVQGQEVFYDSLSTQLADYMELCARKTVEEKTDWLSVQPFRMFWHCLFVSKSSRMDYWMKAFEENGLSSICVEEFINAKIRQYNKMNPTEKLGTVKISSADVSKVITDDVYDNINDREYAAWGDNLWFELLIAGIIWLILVIITMGAFIPALPLCEGLAAVVAIVWFVISFFSGDMEQDIVNGVITNYINHIGSLDLMSQIFI